MIEPEPTPLLPPLSIVIPVYNRADRLPHTLQSVWEQDFRPLQLILVDNASTDRSLEVCQQFAATHDNRDGFRVKVLHQPKRGAACARNRGLEHCETPYVYFFDSDDAMSPHFVSAVVPAMEAGNLDVLAVKTNMSAGGHTRVRDFRYSASPVDQVLMGNLATVSAVYRTGFVAALRWDEDLLTWDDWELGLRVLLARPRLQWHREEAFHHIDVHTDSITGKDFSSTYAWIRKALAAARRDIEQACPAGTAERIALDKALYLRHTILEGWLLREQAGTSARECRIEATACYTPSFWLRTAASLLRTYVRLGGRGAWRIALALC